MLKTLHKLGLDRTEPVEGQAAVKVSRSRVTSSRPSCPTRRPWATGCTARPAPGSWVTGTGKDGRPREVYLYHVVDNA